VRRREYGGAMELLRHAHELAPDNARYAYVYAVALNSTGAHGEATALLDRTHRQHPADRDVFTALVSIAQDRGDLAAALSTRGNSRARCRRYAHSRAAVGSGKAPSPLAYPKLDPF
jgi:predicted Zn-dependent protease